LCQLSIDINRFLNENNLARCDISSVNAVAYTYINESLNHYSKLDYITCDNVDVRNYDVIESSTNLSDHLPLVATCDCNIDCTVKSKSLYDDDSVAHLRWDYANKEGYYNATMASMQLLLADIHRFKAVENASISDAIIFIENVYEKLVTTFQNCASANVPTRRVGFFKYWWSQELDCLKENAIESDKIWKASGRPRSGPIFNKRNSDKRAYKNSIRKNQTESANAYSNDLHDALLAKNGNAFWKCWKSKFDLKQPNCKQVAGLTDRQQIADKFEHHFANLCSAAAAGVDARSMHAAYDKIRPNYVGSLFTDKYLIDAELVENVIVDLKRGKAAGLDGLTAEHLQHCHQLLPCILAKLFNAMLQFGYVPANFGLSYTIPLPKGDKTCNRSLTVDDFRGISISPVLSKVFEYCVLNRFSSYLTTSDNQFGFKKSTGCSHAIYSARSVISHYVAGGSTVNLCALDISKAFDRMNHCGLFVKLMQRHIPVNLLVTIENWFSKCYTYSSI